MNIIPTSTGAAKAVGEVLPELAGRLDGVALRVPVADGSLVDLGVLLDAEATADEVNDAFETPRARSARPASCGTPTSRWSPPTSSATGVVRVRLAADAGVRTLVKVFGWYDNEWGYTCRLVDLTALVAGEPESG